MADPRLADVAATLGVSALSSEPLAGETRVLLVDDHALVRDGLRRLVEEMPGLRVVAEASDGDGALGSLDAEPALVLLDLTLPDRGGPEVARRLLGARPELRVLVVSQQDAVSAVEEALRAGASGYVAKSAPADELRSAIRAVLRGEVWLSPAVAGRLADAVRESGRGERSTPLSARERDVLVGLAEGFSSREVASHLHLSPKTVDAHRVRLMRKLGIHKVSQLVRYAIRAGFVAP